MKLWLGDKPLTVAKAKEFLGWHEAPQGVTQGVVNIGKQRVFLTNNTSNRPITWSTVMLLVQEILRRRYRFNMENIIIGKTGLVLNGQHRLLALIIAAQEWAEHPGKWKDYWQSEPTIETTMALGADESDEVVNTLDTAKPRTLADVIYRSAYFAEEPPKVRRDAARMADLAIRMLWERTGASQDAYAPRRTHAESLDFLARHASILDSVKTILELNGQDRLIGRYTGNTGSAAALLYLMAASGTDRDESGYMSASTPNEGMLDLGRWDDAVQFWTELAGSTKIALPVINAVAKLAQDGVLGGSVRNALVIKAWNSYAATGKIHVADIELDWHTDAEGFRTLAEYPIVGGIDLPDAPPQEEEAEAEADEGEEE